MIAGASAPVAEPYATLPLEPTTTGSPADVSTTAELMGGLVGVHIRVDPPSTREAPTSRSAAERAGRVTLRRIDAWAKRLTRFSPDSALARLNAESGPSVTLRPTLAAVLAAARDAYDDTGGIVDPTLLDARLAAEAASGFVPNRTSADARLAGARWSVRPEVGSRRRMIVERSGSARFDLDGMAKGWIADRAARNLEAFPAVIVDADGDIAISLAGGESWLVGVADPRVTGANLAVLRLVAQGGRGRTRFGLATSGTSVHRWSREGSTTHHLIDPRTGRSAVTDVIQASVLTDSTRRAEAFAKCAVIVGSDAAAGWLERTEISAAILLLESGDIVATPATLGWLT
jgi:thiamine biosynthesis lipoprotein